MLGRARLLLWAIIGLTLLVIGGLFLSGRDQPPASQSASMAGFGGPFTLTASDGKPFASSAQLHGKPFALFFGFTHCPDVCPTTLVRLAKLRRQIGKVEKQWGIYAKKAPQPGGDYSMDHTATVFLVGRDGKFQSTIDPQEDDSPALAKLERLAA